MTTKYDSKCCYCGTLVPAGTGHCWKFAKTNRWYVGCEPCVEQRRSERKEKKTDIRIEFPSMGATYNDKVYGVYQYDVWGKSSVLYGTERRTYLDEFDNLEKAKSAYPDAVVVGGSCFTGHCEAKD